MSLSQVLAPQLQQSLALLQAPTLELKALVEQELEQNPMLEEVPVTEPTQEEKAAGERDESTTQADPAEPPTDVTFDPATEKTTSEPVDDFQAEFERLTQMDQEWRDHFSQTNVPMRQSEDEEERRQFMFDSLVASGSLQENLLEQVRLSDLPEEQRRVAEMIVGNIDERGFLQATLDELAFSTNIPAEQIQAALKEIQQFDPPGVGARNVRECLLLQLERQGKQDSLEYKVVEQYMEALGRRRLPEIARGLGAEVGGIQDAAENVGNLEPNPGRAFLPDDQQYVVAEVFVEKVGDDYVVTNNNTEIPHLRISNAYKDLMSQPNATQEVRDYIREKIRAGKFLIKSIHQRQQTILNIANEIVKRQRDFMDKGVSHLKPMTMVQVAEVVGVHETTVSRAVSGKYIETPQGLFEMKYFFTSGIQTESGVNVSNTSVKEKLSEMIKHEDPAKPLSDEEIVKRLKEEGIVIARRTVAKYRSELNILPSHLRKVY